ncbi:MAG TPA: glycosyltransferase family 2 protein [Dermatophilaceae bacterium]|nr:glycosyltransferase family 2 protein [Dermatophilaceae bacterium]
MILALVPAHNERGKVAAAVDSLRQQSEPPDRIVVVADNCTDDTEEVARAAGAEVWPTSGNHARKAGALNQVLASLLPGLADEDAVLVLDADSVLTRRFLQVARSRLAKDTTIGAIGGVFLGEEGAGLVGELQRNEYTRYARDIARKKARAMVLTGTATLFRVDVLRAVTAARAATLPGVAGRTFDTSSLTEDNEMTLAIKTLGFRTLSPRQCVVFTEVMTTWTDLWRQRVRWQRGAIENLRQYGLSRVTLPYVGQQLGMTLGLVAMWVYLAFTALLITSGQFSFSPVWAGVGLVFVVERVTTVWRRGPAARLLAGVLLPEICYDLFQQAVLVRAAFDTLTKRDAAWHHPIAVRDGR